ncbi:uncharacterized protein [Triticum aestivum]|nr:uncharacterized protein LOC123097133 isoform X2 [Triticum aestivum]
MYGHKKCSLLDMSGFFPFAQRGNSSDFIHVHAANEFDALFVIGNLTTQQYLGQWRVFKSQRRLHKVLSVADHPISNMNYKLPQRPWDVGNWSFGCSRSYLLTTGCGKWPRRNGIDTSSKLLVTAHVGNGSACFLTGIRYSSEELLALPWDPGQRAINSTTIIHAQGSSFIHQLGLNSSYKHQQRQVFATSSELVISHGLAWVTCFLDACEILGPDFDALALLTIGPWLKYICTRDQWKIAWSLLGSNHCQWQSVPWSPFLFILTELQPVSVLDYRQQEQLKHDRDYCNFLAFRPAWPPPMREGDSLQFLWFVVALVHFKEWYYSLYPNKFWNPSYFWFGILASTLATTTPAAASAKLEPDLFTPPPTTSSAVCANRPKDKWQLFLYQFNCLDTFCQQHTEHHVALASAYPEICVEEVAIEDGLFGSFGHVKRIFQPRYLEASKYLSSAADSVPYHCGPVTAGMIFPYGFVSLWKFAWSSWIDILRVIQNTSAVWSCILWAHVHTTNSVIDKNSLSLLDYLLQYCDARQVHLL